MFLCQSWKFLVKLSIHFDRQPQSTKKRILPQSGKRNNKKRSSAKCRTSWLQITPCHDLARQKEDHPPPGSGQPDQNVWQLSRIRNRFGPTFARRAHQHSAEETHPAMRFNLTTWRRSFFSTYFHGRVGDAGKGSGGRRLTPVFVSLVESGNRLKRRQRAEFQNDSKRKKNRVKNSPWLWVREGWNVKRKSNRTAADEATPVCSNDQK